MTRSSPVTVQTPSNLEIAIKAEMARCTRCFHKHSSGARADLAASHRLGYQQRKSLGDFFYVYPDFPNTAFKSRIAAARAALRRAV